MTMVTLPRALPFLALLLCTTAVGQETCDADGSCTGECKDEHEQCAYWATLDECKKNPGYMLKNCQKACDMCGRSSKAMDRMIQKAKGDAEEVTPEELLETAFGVAQTVEMTGENGPKTQAVVDNVTNYMETIVFQEERYHKVKDECKNRNRQCAFWAAIGECEANPNFMTLQCAPTCYSCHLIDFDTRCPYDPTQPTILNPGDLHNMFERITTDEYYVSRYAPTILSMPNPTSDDILDGPWVITLEDVTTEEECLQLIKLGAAQGYEQSMDVGPKKFDGSFEGYKNERRTSTNAWCQDECFNDTMTQSVLEKIENITGVPDSNSEYLQLLQYEPGQFYKTHHDYIGHHTTRQEGVRILTVFLYLNNVEDGGGTDFPDLGITVQPKRGRAVIWPSVKNDDPNAKDARTQHQALPVIKGIKYGANAWLHQRDFKSVFHAGCH